MTTMNINTAAPAKAMTPMTVSGIRSIVNFCGKWPVATPEGIKAWAIIMLKAKVITSGKNIHSRVSQVLMLSQLVVPSTVGSVTGIDLLDYEIAHPR